MANTYTESDAVKKWREQMEAHTGLKPADYTSQWQPQIDQTVNNILNRKEFQYDVNGDALYNMYKDRYVNLGQQAMMDTMGQAAKLTGGYGNSNAQMVGQQAYQSYLQGLVDKIPELAQLAENRYNQQGQNLYNQYSLLSQQEQNAYNQWLQGYNQWLTERDYLSGRYDTERGYDYGVYRDTVADQQWQAQFDEDLRRFNFANGLGEFAPVAVAYGGGGDGGYSSSYNPGSTSTNKYNEVKSDYIVATQSGMSASARNEMLNNAVSSGTITSGQAQQIADIYNPATDKYTAADKIWDRHS